MSFACWNTYKAKKSTVDIQRVVHGLREEAFLFVMADSDCKPLIFLRDQFKSSSETILRVFLLRLAHDSSVLHMTQQMNATK